MLIEKFWVVLKPNRFNTIENIVFESSLEYLRRKFLLGLCMKDIAAIYTEEGEATAHGLELLKGTKALYEERAVL